MDATLEKASKLFLACAFKPVGARRGIFQVTELGFIMDSLTVSERRHLALPDGCLFLQPNFKSIHRSHKTNFPDSVKYLHPSITPLIYGSVTLLWPDKNAGAMKA